MHHSGGNWTNVRIIAFILSSAWLIAAGCFSVFAVSNGDVVIDRFQITGGTGSSDNDFVTIYNRSNQNVDIGGWRLVKRTKTGTTDTTLAVIPAGTNLAVGGSYTWANSSNGFAASIQANISSTQTLSADNGVALRSGAENTGAIIDSVGWGTAANAFVETAPYPSNPGASEIVERFHHADTNDNSVDFKPFGYVPAPVCGNNTIESSETCDDGNAISGDGCSSSCQVETPPAEIPSIVINEFVSDPVSGAEEWVELYNSGNASADMAGWTLEDGGGTKTELSGSIPAHGFLVHKPGGSLNNAGDLLVLRNSAGSIVDTIAYGDWDDGAVSDNIPVASDPNSVARSIDGNGTFVITTTPTKGSANTITAPVIDDEEEEETASSSDIVISEAFINPPGIDSETKAEFIELYNRGDAAVPLEGWRIGVDGFIYEFDSAKNIEPGEYIELTYRLGFRLNNGGGTIKLFAPEKSTAVQTVSYKEAPDGASFMLAYEDKKHLSPSWSWTFQPTPEEQNESVPEPKAGFSLSRDAVATAPIQFDSSDTVGDKTALSYLWDFGDGTTSLAPHPEHVFAKKGTYSVSLTIRDAYGTSSVTKKVAIAALGPELPPEKEKLSRLQTDLVVSEIFPNPKGADGSQEWIEVYNASREPIDLKGWTVALKSKGKAIDDTLEVPAGAYKVLDADLLPGALGNSSDSISLVAPDGSASAVATYADAPESQSYALDKTSWKWTATPTPGKANTVTPAAQKTTAAKKTTAEKKTVTGVVATLPGTFSSQSFYIKTIATDTLEQVYNSKKLFPPLKLGDTVAITGEASKTQAGPRFKTETAEDISITGSSTLPVPSVSLASDVRTGTHPRLAVIEGEIASKKTPRLILTDASGEATVYLASGSGISISTFKVGDKVRVTGITQPDASGYRVQPRSKDDIAFLSASTAPTGTATPETVEQQFGQSGRDNKKELLKYILLASGLVAGGVLYFFWKQKQK